MELHSVVVASRKEQKAALRAQRLERETEAKRAAARKRLVLTVAGSILALAALGGVIALALSGGDGGDGGDAPASASVSFPEGGSVPQQQQADLATAVKAAGCTTADPPEEGSGHTEAPVTYESNPPHSGEHHPVPAEDALYEEAPPKETLVHSLEHGRIVIWVRPDAPPDFLAKLRALYEADPYHVIVTPAPDLRATVAASAWTHTLTCSGQPDDAVFDAIRAFKERWRDKGPEFVP